MSGVWRRAWLGLGGNVGDVRHTLETALDRLDRLPGMSVRSVSGLYETPPWGDTDQASFLNAAAEIETTLEPLALLDAVKGLETALKRVPTRRWGPRTVDIDLIAMEGVEITTGRLVLPHPRAQERAFVLVPLADIAPRLSIGGKTVAQWLAPIDVSEIVRIAEAPFWKREAGGES